MQENTRKYIAKYVEDLHSLVTHGLQPVSNQVSEARDRAHPDATTFIASLEQTLRCRRAPSAPLCAHRRARQDKLCTMTE